MWVTNNRIAQLSNIVITIDFNIAWCDKYSLQKCINVQIFKISKKCKIFRALKRYTKDFRSFNNANVRAQKLKLENVCICIILGCLCMYTRMCAHVMTCILIRNYRKTYILQRNSNKSKIVRIFGKKRIIHFFLEHYWTKKPGKKFFIYKCI